ncbi:IS1595 family transposase [Candidatus Binatus sp.]|uniref:IS1595 family transposase n=1 Tax=Candidatus Binatus sp. TaxID=2811406 RepID=UPI003C82FC8D
MDMNLLKLARTFDSDNRCRQYLEELQWPDGVKCPKCGSKKISRIEKRNQYDCDSCRYQFSVTAGTMLHDSHLPLWKWFAAVYLMCESKKGMSAMQIKRTLSVGYKTAWYLCHRIRAAIQAVEAPQLNGYAVEVDETYVGGKEANKHKSQRHGKTGTFGKTAVIGAIERGGAVRAKVVQNTDTLTLDSFVREAVSQRVTLVATDEHAGYRLLGKGYNHGVVAHGKGEYVVGAIHTNTIESFWSLLKRGIVGSYHKVSKEHLPAYVSEFEFRFNNRKNPYLFRDTLKRLLSTEPLPFEKLTSRHKKAAA